MKKLQWVMPLAAGTAIALLAGCTTKQIAKAPAHSPAPAAPAVPPALPLTQTVARLPELPKLKVKDPTPTFSDRDPFAPLLPASSLRVETVTLPSTAPAASAKAPVKTPVKPPVKSPVKATSVASLPAPQVLPKTTAVRLPASDPLPLPLPLVQPTSNLADAIAITGVLQVGGQLSAIVQEPNAAPRYVQPGAVLADGKVRLKRIVLDGKGEPTVILEENGREVIKSLGSVVAQGW